jgi:hypothetical protein
LLFSLRFFLFLFRTRRLPCSNVIFPFHVNHSPSRTLTQRLLITRRSWDSLPFSSPGVCHTDERRISRL